MRKKIIFILGILVLSMYILSACKIPNLNEDGLYTQFGFQKPPTDVQISSYNLTYSKEQIQEYVENKDITALMYALSTNKEDVPYYAYFHNMNAELDVSTIKDGKKIGVTQYASHAEAIGPKGTYIKSVNAMTRLEALNVNATALAQFFKFCERRFKTKDGVYEYVNEASATSNVSYDNPTTELAGSTADWNSKTEKIDLTKIEEEIEEIPEFDVANDGQLYFDDETSKYYPIDGDEYYYFSDSALTYGEAGYVFDTYIQDYSKYVRDYNAGDDSNKISSSEKKGKALPMSDPNYDKYIFHTLYVLNDDTINFENSTIEHITEDGYTFYRLNIKIKDADLCGKYAKAEMVKDLNSYVAPFDYNYTNIEMTIDFWECGLFKKWYRDVNIESKGHVKFGFGDLKGPIINKQREVFSYLESDYNTDNYTNDNVWKNFSKA